jgi:hypothetical protein
MVRAGSCAGRCGRMHSYLGIVVPERKAKLPVQAINGREPGRPLFTPSPSSRRGHRETLRPEESHGVVDAQ